jgi:HTH-type transcriptional regulator/antitoxin HigA
MPNTIKPIRTEAAYQAALGEVWKLMDAEPGSADEETLEVLSILVAEYERAHYPITAPDPIALITYVMDAQGLSRRDLAPLLGGPSRVTEILGRRRRLTLSMMRRLNAELKIPLDMLMAPYDLAPSNKERRERVAV